MYKRLNQLIAILKVNLGLLLSIGLGVFLFVLFFQPFPLDQFDFNNRLLIFAGLAAIVFLFDIVRIMVPWGTRVNLQNNNEIILSSYIIDFLVLALVSVAFAFYLRYVGRVSITFYIMFKVVLIAFASLVILRISESFRELQHRNELLKKHQIEIEIQLENYEDNLLSKSIEIISENRNENLKLQITDIAFLRSADNYVEIFIREGKGIKKELIRNTLKNIEQQIKPFNRFIRCHRTSIVNVHYIDKLNNSLGNYWLSLREIEEKIPVSRQYLLKVKEVI